MPTLKFDNVSKQFGDTQVIHGFDAEVADQEFLVLLGPSGCGKSTMLRMIAGLTEISSGRLLFDDRLVNDLEPSERDIAFVFQSYALYPHMSVRENIAFPLVMDRFRTWHHIPVVNVFARRAISRSPEVSQAVDECARMLELEDLLDRKPKNLSGGQRQRVAVARALVRQPSVYLLDEPLSNLDAKLRTQMRAQIAALHERVGRTFVYVTHDQVEAMTMGTRIIVLDQGSVQQYGSPSEIYERPANTFVARFIGAPPMNLLPAELTAGEVAVHGRSLAGNGSVALPDGSYQMGLRPEKIALHSEPSDGVPASVVSVEHLGGESVIGFLIGATDRAQSLTGLGDEVVYLKVPGATTVRVGDRIGAGLDPASASWFSASEGERVEPGEARDDRSGATVNGG